jgi:hypothetical protein
MSTERKTLWRVGCYPCHFSPHHCQRFISYCVRVLCLVWQLFLQPYFGRHMGHSLSQLLIISRQCFLQPQFGRQMGYSLSQLLIISRQWFLQPQRIPHREHDSHYYKNQRYQSTLIYKSFKYIYQENPYYECDTVPCDRRTDRQDEAKLKSSRGRHPRQGATFLRLGPHLQGATDGLKSRRTFTSWRCCQPEKSLLNSVVAIASRFV